MTTAQNEAYKGGAAAPQPAAAVAPVAAGFMSPVWPVAPSTGRAAILGVEGVPREPITLTSGAKRNRLDGCRANRGFQLARCAAHQRAPSRSVPRMIALITHQQEDRDAVRQISTRHPSDPAGRRRAHQRYRPVLLSAPVYHPSGAVGWNLQPWQPSRRYPAAGPG